MQKTIIIIVTTCLVLLLAQNMGINVDEPTEALDVDGNIKLTGAVKFADGSQQLTATTGLPPFIMPAGVILQYAGENPPDGWMLCDGSEISRENYSQLFTFISTIYGEGDGTTTFNLPDLRGRVAIGLDNMGGISANRVLDQSGNTLGGFSGAERHLLTANELPPHSHPLDFRCSYGSGATTGCTNGAIVAYHTNGILNTENSSNNFSFNKMQPYLAINYIIKY